MGHRDFECSHITTTRKTDTVMRRSLKQFTKASGYGNSFQNEYQLWKKRKRIKLSYLLNASNIDIVYLTWFEAFFITRFLKFSAEWSPAA